MSKKMVKRGDGTKQGTLVEMTDPRFLTIVKTPANRRAFSAIRSDSEEGANMTKPNTVVRRTKRARRSDAATNLARIQFPTGYTVETAQEAMSSFGLSSGYEIEEQENTVVATRSDLKSISEDTLQTVRLTEDGIQAFVVRSEATVEATGAKNHIALVALEFSAEVFDQGGVVEFLERHDIDIPDDKFNTSASDVTVVVRRDVEEGEETRKIELEDGVVGVVTRADQTDVPAGFVKVIDETAYSGWGWGQLDFAAQLADVQVGEQLREGMYILEETMREILFWSPLPVDARKALISRTLQQFDDYARGLLDLLPRELLIAVTSAQRSDKETTTSQESTKMTKATTGTTQKETEAARTDAPAADVTETTQPTATAASEMIQISRADLESTVAAAAKAAVEAVMVSRKDEAGTEAPAAETQEDGATVVTRSDLAEAMKPLADAMVKLSGITVVRSDEGDPAPVAKEAKRGDDMFRGCIPGLRA